ncbi:hypothetical protein HDU96_001753 [Phlyctochytrium bullatum]|nr:hypothetical protein HDU96_001753 [Phlyctochytrium bullatum]
MATEPALIAHITELLPSLLARNATPPQEPHLVATALSGGLVNNVHRIAVFPNLAANEPVASFVAKHYPPFVRAVPEFALSTARGRVEYESLKAIASARAESAMWLTPKPLHHDAQQHIVVMEDLGTNLTSLTDRLGLNAGTLDVEAVASGLAGFLEVLHGIRVESHPELTEALETSKAARGELTKGLLADISATLIPALGEESAAKWVGRYAALEATDKSQVLAFGDLWPYSVLLSPDVSRLHIIDFEFANLGSGDMDMVQFAANLFLMSHLPSQFNVRVVEDLLDAFLRQVPKDREYDHEAAFVGQLAVAVGYEVWNWGQGQEENKNEVLRKGVDAAGRLFSSA